LAEEYQLLDGLKKRLEFLELLKKRLAGISDQRQLEMSTLSEEIIRAEDHLEITRLETETLAQDNMVQSTDQTVRIRRRVHPKVTVTIGHKKYFSTNIKGGINIYRKGNELLVEPNAQV